VGTARVFRLLSQAYRATVVVLKSNTYGTEGRSREGAGKEQGREGGQAADKSYHTPYTIHLKPDSRGRRKGWVKGVGGVE
jgi:hypothetical protein